MNLDLEQFTSTWPCPTEGLSARLILGRDGRELVQLRVDMGILQMFPDGRPDGQRYHGLPTALGYVQHEAIVTRRVRDGDWNELSRELHQFNYRRLALTTLAEGALRRHDDTVGRELLTRSLRDIDTCLSILRTMEQHRRSSNGAASLIPELVFHRARLRVRMRVMQERFDEAIDEAESGVRDMELVLSHAGGDNDLRELDTGCTYLKELAHRLREQHHIDRTLREQLQDALDDEDFELAARLRDQIRARDTKADIRADEQAGSESGAGSDPGSTPEQHE